MGQNAQALFKTPEQVRAERLKQQQAMYASAQSPYERMGMAIGNILGGALGVKDPAMERASAVQSIYNSVLQANPDTTSPEFYSTLAQQLAGAGLAQEANYAVQEGYKYRRDAAAERRAERGLAIQEEQLLLQQVDKDPYGSIERAMAFPEDDPRRSVIITGASAKIGEKNTAEAMRMAEVAKTAAQTELARAQLGQVGAAKASETIATEDGYPLSIRKGKYYRQDGTEYKGRIKKLSATEDLLSRIEKLEGKGGEGGGKEKTDAEVRAKFSGKKPTTTSATPTTPSRLATDRVPPRPPDSFNGVRNPEAATWDRLYSATYNRNGIPKAPGYFAEDT